MPNECSFDCSLSVSTQLEFTVLKSRYLADTDYGATANSSERRCWLNGWSVCSGLPAGGVAAAACPVTQSKTDTLQFAACIDPPAPTQ